MKVILNVIISCENESALLIISIFYLKIDKNNLSMEDKNLKWEEISL